MTIKIYSYNKFAIDDNKKKYIKHLQKYYYDNKQ